MKKLANQICQNPQNSNTIDGYRKSNYLSLTRLHADRLAPLVRYYTFGCGLALTAALSAAMFHASLAKKLQMNACRHPCPAGV
jgi:hypothetical protein